MLLQWNPIGPQIVSRGSSWAAVMAWLPKMIHEYMADTQRASFDHWTSGFDSQCSTLHDLTDAIGVFAHHNDIIFQSDQKRPYFYVRAQKAVLLRVVTGHPMPHVRAYHILADYLSVI